MRCLVRHAGLEGGLGIVSLASLPEFLKTHPEGAFRCGFLVPDGKETIDQLMASAKAGTLSLLGPLTVTHAVRRARDLLLEACEYDGLRLEVEVAGKRLPELPPRQELEHLLQDPGTLVIVDGRPYKAATEVFGFQQVYDDAVRVIDGLKRMGVPQETMAIFATADEISVEVHPDVFGLGPDPLRSHIYQHLLMELGGIRSGDRGFIKTGNRTILLDTVTLTSQILLPGSTHPNLHRPKVGVGPSHFAYGTAAFSDYCGKKRDLEECLKELKTWVKFLDTQIPPVPALKAKIEQLAARPAAEAAGGSVGGTASPVAPTGFRPIRQEVQDLKGPPGIRPVFSTTFPELDRALGGGWTHGGVHLLLGSREEGKGAFLLGQAQTLAAASGVLYLSRELDRHEFIVRASAWLHKISLPDLLQRKTQADPMGQTAVSHLEKLAGGLAAHTGETLFFRGSDSAVDILAIDQISQLVGMIPAGAGRILVLESLLPEDLWRPSFLPDLRRLAETQEVTILLSAHLPPLQLPRPHFLEADDLPLLDRLQRWTDSVTVFLTERVNLRKFLAMSQGKADPAAVTQLEAQMLQGAGGKKMRGDTFTITRTIHARYGFRQAILYFYQRASGRFFEGPALPLGRP